MKIFCIGFQKTGTTSVGKALELLGYSVTGAHGTRDPNISETVYQWVENHLPLYDAFRDNPWAVLYEYLDHLCPGSKFILTVREPESWLSSIVSHCGRRSTSMRKWIYGFGNPRGHEQEYMARYMRHNAEVLKYFSGREGTDLLVMDLQKGDGWERLCPFLGLQTISNTPFPHRNRASNRSMKERIRGEVTAVMERIRGQL